MKKTLEKLKNNEYKKICKTEEVWLYHETGINCSEFHVRHIVQPHREASIVPFRANVRSNAKDRVETRALDGFNETNKIKIS